MADTNQTEHNEIQDENASKPEFEQKLNQVEDHQLLLKTFLDRLTYQQSALFDILRNQDQQLQAIHDHFKNQEGQLEVLKGLLQHLGRTEDQEEPQIYRVQLHRKDTDLHQARWHLDPRDVRENREDMQIIFFQNLTHWLVWIFSSLVAFSILILIIQGWHIFGFNLSDEILKLIITATIAEVAGLLVLLIRALIGIGK